MLEITGVAMASTSCTRYATIRLLRAPGLQTIHCFIVECISQRSWKVMRYTLIDRSCVRSGLACGYVQTQRAKRKGRPNAKANGKLKEDSQPKHLRLLQELWNYSVYNRLGGVRVVGLRVWGIGCLEASPPWRSRG